MNVSHPNIAESVAEGGTTVSPRPGLSQLFGQGIFTLADQMVASITTFLTGVLVGRICTTEDFGYYTLGFSLYTLLLTLQNSMVTTPFQIYYPRLRATSEERFIGSYLIQQAVLGLGVAALTACGAAFAWLALGNTRMANLLLALALAMEFLLLRDFIRQLFFARLAARGVLAFDAAVAIGQLSAIAVLAKMGWLGGATAYLALGLTCLLAACIWYSRNQKHLKLGLRAAWDQFGEHWPAVKWLLASGLLWSVSTNLYAWLLAGFHGAASAGVWGAALGIAMIINPLTIGAQNFLAPRIARAYAEDGVSALNRFLLQSTTVYAGSLVLFSLVMAFLGDPLVTLIYGDKYQGTGIVVAIIALNFALNAVGFTVSRGLFTLEKARIDFQVNVAALASMLLVGLWLARHYGPVGAALGQVVTNTIACAIRGGAYFACQRSLRMEVAK
jgi:O-antigen/teichoic acid export membrane protein